MRSSRSTVVRRTAATTVTLLALGGLAACGSNDSGKAADAGSTSSASPVAAPSAGATVDPTTFVNDVLGGLTQGSTAHLTMTMEGGPAGISMEGDVDYSAKPPEMAMTMTNTMMGGGKIQMRLVDGVMYMQMPNVGRGKWVKLDLNATGSPLSGALLEHLDPSEQLKQTEDAVTKVVYVGEETVDGETLRHYTMTVRGEAFRDLQKELGTSGGANLPSVITYDVWTDASGQLRQTKIAMGDLGSVTMKISDWGQPVDIQAPPDSDVITLPSGMASGMMG